MLFKQYKVKFFSQKYHFFAPTKGRVLVAQSINLYGFWLKDVIKISRLPTVNSIGMYALYQAWYPSW